MIRQLKKISLTAWLALPFFGPIGVSAQTYDFASSSGLRATGGSAGFTEALMALQPESLAAQILMQVLGWLGVLFLGLAIYGGITWMTAEGNEQKVEKAKNILVGAISGLVVISLAYAVSYFVIKYFTQGTLG